MKKLLLSMLLVSVMCGAANADFVTVADWQFTGGALTTDSSGNGHTLNNYLVTESGSDTAVFNGGSQLWTAAPTLDLTPYRQARVSFRMKTNVDTIGMLYELGFILNPGTFCCTVNEVSTGVGSTGLDSINNEQLLHANYVWQDVVIEYNVDEGPAADVVRVWVGGVELPDSSTYGINGSPPAGYSFTNDVFCIGARNGPSLGFNGELDYLTVEGQVPEPATMALLGFGGIMVLVRRRRS